MNPFKNKFKKILSRLGILRVVQSWKEKFSASYIDKRVFWNGQPLKSPDTNTFLFKDLKKESFTVTHDKESRDCVFLKPNEDITMKININDKSQIALNFAYGAKPKLSEGVEVFLNGIKKADLKYIVPNKWHRVSINSEKKENILNIKNTCSSAIEVAHPVIEREHESRDQTPKNIIILLLDALNRDSLGSFYPDARKYSPNITRFFEKGFKYANCFAQSEWTFPAIYSIFLSKYSVDHGLSDTRNDFEVIPSNSEDSLAVKIRELGYSTFAYSTVKVFHPGLNAHAGFDRFFYDLFPQPVQTHREICFRAINQLQQNSKGKNFMFLHFFDTHEPWRNVDETEENLLDNIRVTDPETEYNFYKRGQGDTKGEPIFDEVGARVLLKRRNARLFNVDLSLQILFDYLEKSGEVQNTMVVLCSDHGCKFLGWQQPLFCDTRVGVPLLISHPKINGAMQHELVEAHMDLGPTILKTAGYESNWGNGKILPPFGEHRHEYVVSESIYGNLCKVAVRNEKYVYHCTFPYNKKNKRISLNRPYNQLLFERVKEEMCVDVSNTMPQILENMHDFLINHFNKYPHRIG